MNIRPVNISCHFCGHGNVSCRTQTVKMNGKTKHKLKWICPKCGRLVKQAYQESK